MIVFTPDKDIKLSIWIHANLNEQKRIHPIINKSDKASEREFYNSLKSVMF